MENTALLVLLALAQYLYFTIRVGLGRGKHGIAAPATSGSEIWERWFRVQQNTLEQLIVFIPSAVLFGFYISGIWVLMPGVVFLVGRQLYASAYLRDPASRGPGMGLTFLGNIALVIGAAAGVLLRLF